MPFLGGLFVRNAPARCRRTICSERQRPYFHHSFYDYRLYLRRRRTTAAREEEARLRQSVRRRASREVYQEFRFRVRRQRPTNRPRRYEEAFRRQDRALYQTGHARSYGRYG